MGSDRADQQSDPRSLGAIAVALVEPAVDELRAGYAELVGRLAASGELRELAQRGGVGAVVASDAPEIAALRKAGRELATEAERAAEARMRQTLRTALPGHAVVGEELGADGEDGDALWVIDPVDGTSAMVRCAIADAFGLPLGPPRPAFGITIGVLRGDEPVVGVVVELSAADGALTRASTWLGVAGGPTTRDGVPVAAVGAPPQLADAVLACTVPEVMFASRAARTRFARVRDATRELVVDLNCIGYMRLLGGGVDIVIEADLALPDAAALIPPLAGAGVVVTDHAGRPPRFDADARAGEYRLLAAAPELHRQALAALNAAARGGPAPAGGDALRPADDGGARPDATVHAGYARKFPQRAATLAAERRQAR